MPDGRISSSPSDRLHPPQVGQRTKGVRWPQRRIPGRSAKSVLRPRAQHGNNIKGLVLTLIFDSLPELKILKNGCSSLSNENVTMDTKCPIYSFPANTIQIFKLIKNFGAYQSTYDKTNNNSLFK